ncbi:ribonuclease H-like domain-containing protein [Tanacetum coccineum]
MEFESAQSNTTAKLPILKLVPVTAEEKTNKKNDVKARSLLLMALPNEHQLTFSQYSDAKTIASSTESLDSIFNRLKRLNTHVVFWINKAADIKTMSIDDLYNNFKIVKQDVKKYVGASSGAQNLAFMTTPSTSSTNDVNTANLHMNNGFKVTALSAKYEGKKVECFKCHKMGHFARECRASKNKEGQFRYQDNTRKQGNNKDTSSKAMLAIYGVSFDWSDMAEE